MLEFDRNSIVTKIGDVVILRLVILSEAKDLLFSQRTRQQVLRFAQDDNP